MNSIARLGVLIACALACVSCNHRVTYHGKVDSVQAQGTSVAVTDGSTYVDEHLLLKSGLTEDGHVTLAVVNRTAETMRIHWDECLFEDVQGKTHRIMHSGVRYAARNERQPPTLILAGHTHTDKLSCTDMVEFQVDYSSGGGDWVDRGMLKSRFAIIDGNPSDEIQESLIGKPMKLHLAIEVLGKQQSYVVTMSVVDADVSKRPLNF